ncbi:MAG: alpha/beta hydrolase [Verrucomicrobiales bacterium]|nr:alpha/beta hydrolase [Verrucomicrobiales bacterium]
MKSLFATLSLILLTHVTMAEPLAPIPLWPDGVPGEDHLELPEESIEVKGEYQIDILSNVSNPTLTWYPAKEPNGAAVLVLPGGGYNILAMSHEGTEVCEWLNSIGIAAGLVKYRVPRREGLEPHEAPLQDVQRAMGIVRTNAIKWNINPERVGVLGFSAGGNLSTMALSSDGRRDYQPDSAFDTPGCIPDFGILIYPAYLNDPENPDDLAPGIVVNEKTPPVFMAVSDEDRRFVEGSARFYIEMHRHDRPCELHIFSGGRHGFGLDKIDSPIKQWPMLAQQWMNELGLMTP